MHETTGWLRGIAAGVPTGWTMGLKLMIWAKDLLEVMFLVGLIGCTSTVVISWVSILKSAFSSQSND